MEVIHSDCAVLPQRKKDRRRLRIGDHKPREGISHQSSPQTGS
uniref:Uncharacterized protein n=1 Tax=Anguilla anguilla TaxID=7936 RepID=A0A0E9WL05_ANGAN